MEYRYTSRTGTQDLEIAEDISNENDNEEDEDDDEESEDEDEEEDSEDDDEDEEQAELPYPGFVPVSLKYLDQTSRPRNWCLAMITNSYPFLLDIKYFLILESKRKERKNWFTKIG